MVCTVKNIFFVKITETSAFQFNFFSLIFIVKAFKKKKKKKKKKLIAIFCVTGYNCNKKYFIKNVNNIVLIIVRRFLVVLHFNQNLSFIFMMYSCKYLQSLKTKQKKKSLTFG